nr:MAG TPA: minor capsid protein [Caudoviricetes sp.]
MSIENQHSRDRETALWLRDQIYKLIEEQTIPTTIEALWDLVTALLPLIHKARKAFYHSAAQTMTEDMRARGMEIDVAPMRPYQPNAAWKMLLRALGWNPKKDPIPGDIESYSKDAQRVLLEKVAAFPANPADPVALAQVSRRVAAGAVRHARAAGRDVVVDTAAQGRVRVSSSRKRPRVTVEDGTGSDGQPKVIVEYASDDRKVGDDNRELRKKASKAEPDSTKPGGKVLGWARVLTGAESCAFCAMLASRGPVYSEDTVVTTGKPREVRPRQVHYRNPGATGGHTYVSGSRREGEKYHDHCDCIAVLVVKGVPWNGEQQYHDLKDLWDDATFQPTQEELDAGLDQPRDRFTKRYTDAIKADPEKYSALKVDPEKAEPDMPPSEIRKDMPGEGVTLDFEERREKVYIPPEVRKNFGDNPDWLYRLSAEEGATNPATHEWDTLITLLKHGHTVRIRRLGEGEKKTSPDIVLDDVITEMKAPDGGGKNTIPGNLREAKKNFSSLMPLDVVQIVIDGARLQRADEQVRIDLQMCLKNPRFSWIDRIIYINHDGEEEEFIR